MESQASLPPPPSPSPNQDPTPNKNLEIPTPQQLISEYESQGLDTNEASMRVIEDLQNVLSRVVNSNRGKQDRFMLDTSRNFETVASRLAILELKVDSKPGYSETLALGVAAGGVVSVVPHVLGAIGEVWNAVKGATKS